jgi:hypothetical protein
MSERPWPPLIVADTTPGWVKWRDGVLTCLMWGLFLYMLDDEFELVIERNLVRFGLGDYRTDPNWPQYFGQLTPYLSMSLALIGLLIVATAFTLIRRARSMRLPSPVPLELAAEAQRAGLSAGDLAAARDLRIAVVHIEPDGRHKVEAR